MDRRSFLKVLGLAPAVAVGVGEADARAEKPPLLVAKVPVNTPDHIRGAILAQLERCGHANAMVIEAGIELEYVPPTSHDNVRLHSQPWELLGATWKQIE